METESNNASSDHTSTLSGGLFSQVSAWIRDEKAKRDARKAKHKHATLQVEGSSRGHRRHTSDISDDGVDLAGLESILKEALPYGRSISSRSSNSLRRRPSARKLHKASTSSVGLSSDTDYFEGEPIVPSVDAWLDNSKTLGYTGGSVQSSEELSLQRTLTASEEGWIKFKYEIVRLTHTLRLRGWRRMPMDLSGDVEVERLSGALTNAVYVVSPPKDYPPRPNIGEDVKQAPKKPPAKLLLRIYGPQVEHLIDREAELQILRRLARKKIGPRLLGTFSNGRFEEYFHAGPLTPKELRDPDTSKQIAKRMRELHDGIELLDTEREEGAFVWRNWDKWFQRVEDIVMWLDSQVLQHHGSDATDVWEGHGFICGTRWAVFKDTVQKYRAWLEKLAGGATQLSEELVFAHNDTQYGNILRMLPSGTSPLLLPANTHKQLVVIDFEYASANTVGLEFANHFTEWCYNYHDAGAPWRCNTSGYPRPDEQNRFVRAYVRHRPEFNIQTPKMSPMETVPESRAVSPSRFSSSTPQLHRPPGPTQSISNFMLDARSPASVSTTSLPTALSVPPANSTEVVDQEAAAYEEGEVTRLIQQTRIWRLANTAQWVAWGIVQAKVPGMPLISPGITMKTEPKEATEEEMSDLTAKTSAQMKIEEKNDAGEGIDGESTSGTSNGDMSIDEEEAKEEEFDYLSYARDRAMFFWGDAVELGFVNVDDLPADVKRDIKTVRY